MRAGLRDALRRFLDPRSLLTVLPFVALVVLAAVLSYRYHVLLQAQRARVEHTYQVITRLEAILGRLIDAETGQRGYVITGDAIYLQPYRDAIRTVPGALVELRATVADNRAQLDRIDALEASLATKFAELRETIEVRQSRGAEAAGAVVMRDSGRVAMDRLRDVIAALKQRELSLLAERTAALEHTERQLLATTVLCTTLSLIARAGLAWTARRRQAQPIVRA